MVLGSGMLVFLVVQFGFANYVNIASLTETYGKLQQTVGHFYFPNSQDAGPIVNGYFPGSAMANGDTAGVTLDMDNGTWQFFKNGVGVRSIH